MTGRAAGTVAFRVPREVAFDYLVDPANRAEWQSSLRRVDDVVGEIGAHQSWTDVTVPGLRPAMRTDAYEPYVRWSESGRWRGVTAFLRLEFRAVGAWCEVDVFFQIDLPVVPDLVGVALTRASAPAVRADLRRAARILAERSEASSF